MGVGATAVMVLKTLTLVAGGLVTYYAIRAYRRTNARSHGIFGLGFGVVTVGSLLAGVVDTLLPLGREAALVAESTFTLVGFTLVLYALFAE